MGRIGDNTLRDWNNGETIYEADYEQERSVLKTAINDNFDRLIKKFEVLKADGTLETTQNLDTAINYLKFQETSTVALVLDNTSSTLTMSVIDGSITTAKLADLGVTTAKLADLNVTTAKIADLNVTRGKIADGAVNLQKLDLTSLDSRYYTETELDAGQLDNRYYTETELNNGVLDTRYYTESEVDPQNADGTADFSVSSKLDKRYYTEPEIDNKFSETAGGMAYSFNNGTSFPTSPLEGDVFYRNDLDQAYIYIDDGVDVKWKPLGGGKFLNFSNTKTLTSDSSNVAIGINEFNKTDDKLLVFKNTTYLHEGADYTINADGVSIDKVSGTWASGTTLDFIVFKTADTDPVYKDGGLLSDKSVTKVKLASAIQTTLTNADNHHADTTNPHSVTASQVGAPTTTDFRNQQIISMWGGW